MNEIRQTVTFSKWIQGVSNSIVKAKILIKIDRLQIGLKGNAKSVGDRVSEIKIYYGSGYRIYYTKRGKKIIILLAGGTKGSQKRDIKIAKKLAKEV